jgi:putative DNA primase/helicase
MNKKANVKDKPAVRKVTTTLVNNALLALSGYTLLGPRTPQPSWLADPAPFPPEDVVPFRNALVYLPGLVEGDPEAVCAPTPRFFSSFALDYDFDPNAPAPVRWLAFLKSLWPEDPESIETLQEWMGHLLTPDTTHQKILMMIGPKRSGRGTIARIIKAMLGADNVANPTLASLATNFGLAPLIGKPCAIITDARLSGRTDVVQVVERLLSISGEDSQTIDRKHLPAVTVKLPTRFTLISNEMPRLTDTSGALAGRLILLPLTVSFFGREDRQLTADLLTELPGILLWAIQGWQRLRERGRFLQPASGAEMVEEMEDLSSPIGAFLKDRCEVKPGAEVRAEDLFEAWRWWCESTGRKYTGTAQEFGRDLRAVMPNLTTKQHRGDQGRKRFYQGIALKPDDVDRVAEWLKARIDAWNTSVRDSVQDAGAEGFLKRRKDGEWDARPLWEAGRRIGYVPSNHETGKAWVPAPGKNDTG